MKNDGNQFALTRQSTLSLPSRNIMTHLFRIFRLLVLVLCLSPVGFAQQNSTYGDMIRVPLNSVTWNSDSFWGMRISATRTGLANSMTPLMLGSDKSHFVHNFRIAAGYVEGKHRGPAWNDGDCYKWIEALSAHYAQTSAPGLRAILDEVIPPIVASQRPDGYLHTPVIIEAKNQREGLQSFRNPIDFEMYNMGHLMTAATMHFEATGDRRLLDVAIKAADYLDDMFNQLDAQKARHAICPAHYMGILDLYRCTGEKRYLDLCQRWLRMRDLVEGGGDDNQDRIPFREQREAVGHAVRANYLYAGAADLFLETKEPELFESLRSCWESVHHRKIYVTGGCGALYDGASPDGSDKQSVITRIHQAYGRNYQLPNSAAHNETCAAVGNVLWNLRMWQITQHAKYIDALENSLYNAVLAGVSLDGEKFFYTNTLRHLDEMPTKFRWSRQRESWISCYCCPPNVARTIAQVGRMAYSIHDRATIVLLYGSNDLKAELRDGQRIALRQSSDYPVQGQSLLQIQAAPDYPYSIGLRVPGWCTSAQIKLNGETQSIQVKPGSIECLTRVWKPGDTIDLHMEMPVQYLSAHPLVEECRGQIAVRRGPLIYCVESHDLPNNATVQHVSMPAGLEQNWILDMGTGEMANVPFLRGELMVKDNEPQVDPSTLYRPYHLTKFKTESAKLVPYYAWGNRGRSEMSVWIELNP